LTPRVQAKDPAHRKLDFFKQPPIVDYRDSSTRFDQSIGAQRHIPVAASCNQQRVFIEIGSRANCSDFGA
jgi:hypothetical protein